MWIPETAPTRAMTAMPRHKPPRSHRIHGQCMIDYFPRRECSIQPISKLRRMTDLGTQNLRVPLVY